MNFLSAIALALASPATGASELPVCAQVPGWETVLSRRSTRFIVIGELHGTNEMPDLFGELACLSARSRKLIIALEQPDIDQPAIDSYLGSDGGPEAKLNFLTTSSWAFPIKDGRQSEAYFRLLERLRQMKVAGNLQSLVAFQPSQFTSPPSDQQYEQRMADTILAAWKPGTTVLVFVGNAHARLTRLSFGQGYLPMASLLPRKATQSFDIDSEGGSAWECTGQPVVCGPNTWPSPLKQHKPGVMMSAEKGSSYSGIIYLGAPSTASFPQKY